MSLKLNTLGADRIIVPRTIPSSSFKKLLSYLQSKLPEQKFIFLEANVNALDDYSNSGQVVSYPDPRFTPEGLISIVRALQESNASDSLLIPISDQWASEHGNLVFKEQRPAGLSIAYYDTDSERLFNPEDIWAAHALVMRRLEADREKLRQLTRHTIGKRCFVLGNGPSLKNIDLSLLSSELSIGSNGIFHAKKELGFTPLFYSVEDILCAEDNPGKIAAMNSRYMFMPIRMFRLFNNMENIIYLPYYQEGRHAGRFSTDVSEVIYSGSTVTFFNLQIAYSLGIREVYLLGVDMNYSISTERDIETASGVETNHFTDNYYKSGHRFRRPKIELSLKSIALADTEYRKDGRIIYNATAGGKLDLLPRKDYASLFSH